MTTKQPNDLNREQEDAQALADERTILGMALTDETRVIEVISLVPVHDLWKLEHQRLLVLIGQRLRDHEACDLVSISTQVQREGAERFGGLGYVMELADEVPSRSLALEPIAARIRERYRRRMLVELGHAFVKAGVYESATYDGEVLPDEVEAIASNAMQWLTSLSDPAQATAMTIGEAMEQARNDRADLAAADTPPSLSTGHARLDAVFSGGTRPGDLIVVAGRPGWGKTAFALGWCADLAAQGHGVAYLSMEQTPPDLSNRVLARVTGTSFTAIRNGEYDDDIAMEAHRTHITTWPVWLEWLSRPNVAEIIAAGQRYRARGVTCLVVDYLQLVSHPQADRHDIAIGLTTSALKNLAMRLGMTVVLLSQLNRDIDRRQGKRKRSPDQDAWWDVISLPCAADLRDSGCIEADADAILFPIRAGAFGVEPASAGAVVVAKNRNGPEGVVPAMWDGRTVSYREIPAYDDGGAA